MNSLGYSNPNFDPQQSPVAFFDHLVHQRLIIRNDQATPLLNLPLMQAIGLGLVLFPLAALLAGGIWVGLLSLEVKQR